QRVQSTLQNEWGWTGGGILLQGSIKISVTSVLKRERERVHNRGREIGATGEFRSRRLGLLLELDQVLHSVVHLLDGLELGQTKTSLVGDVVNAALGVGVLAVDSTDLELESVADGLEVGLGRDLGQTDVDGGAHGGSQVGGAEGQPAETLVSGEGSLGLDCLDSLDEALEHLSDVSAVLHGDDAEVVLLIAPHEEGLVFVVEDTASLGPVAAGVGVLEEAVALLEEEVVSDQLVLHLLGHAVKGVATNLELSVLNVVEDLLDLALHLEVVGLGEAGVEGVSLEGATATDAGRVDELACKVEVRKEVGLALSEVGGGLLLVGAESVVVYLDQGVEEGLEEGVGLGVRRVDSDSRVEVGDSGLDDVQEGGSQLGLLVLELVHHRLGEVLLQQRVAFRGGLQLGIAVLDLLDGCGVDGHGCGLVLVLERRSATAKQGKS
ncbi:hypothetical protein PMAYCL1PPCAC_00353, partial [Pristionchus mayeri]